MFEGFETSMVDTGEATLRVRHGGSGPPLLLLHGYPQTHAMWHKVGPMLARDFTVVAPDLRGYGESSKPETMPDHEPYSKRAMARDAVALMQHFGFDSFAVAGHDRGGRVAYRLALDHPNRVSRLATLDIIPTGDMWRGADMAFGLRAWHWFFLAQPYPLPEKMIGADPDAYYYPNRDAPWLEPEALADYLRAVHDPATIHAMCEDYRAGASYDFELDEADRGKKRITCPMLALWGSRGSLSGGRYDALKVWREWAGDVRGGPVNSGHYLAEEAPEETHSALREFFGGGEG
jgi:haloacetate dehalogenase